MTISIGTSGGHAVGFDLGLLLKTRLLLTADSGGGKSWVIRKLAEELYGKVPVIIIDPEGEMSTLREKYDYVLVGKGGETPADPRSAALVAHRLLELHASAVCDLYELKSHDRHAWVRNYLEALIEAPKKLWRPVVVLVDEAHVFCPEKGKGESSAAPSMIDICTRGRKRGICAIFATQRLGMLNKDASSNLQNRLIGPTFEDVNRKRAAELLGISPGAPEREFSHQMQTLEPGNFWAFGRAISTERILVRIGPVKTSHPEMGSGKHSLVVPPAPAKVRAMMPQLSDLPKEAESKAVTEAEFRREIRELQNKLRTAERTSAAADPVIDTGAIAREVKRSTARLEKQLSALQSKARVASELARRLTDSLTALASEETPAAVPVAAGPLPTPQLKPVAAWPTPAARVASSNGDGPPLRETGWRLGTLSRQIAGVLAAFFPEPVDKDWLATVLGRSSTGGSWSARLSELRTAGLLEDAGVGFVKASADCSKQFAGSFLVPSTTEEVLQLWLPKLGALNREMLRVLIERRGEPMTREELAAAVDREATGGSWAARLSELRSTRLMVDAGRGLVAANKEALFL